MKKIILLVFFVCLLSFCLADKPASSGVVSSLSEIHIDQNNIFFDKAHHFSVTLFDSTGATIANEPCVYWTEFKATGNVLETYEMKPNCPIGLEDCYFTSNQDGNLFGVIYITDEYYDIGREYTLRVSCDNVTASIDFNVLRWKDEQTLLDFGDYVVDNTYLVYVVIAIIVIGLIGLLLLYKLIHFIFFRQY